MKTRNQIFIISFVAAVLSMGSSLQADDTSKKAESSASSSIQSGSDDSSAQDTSAQPSSSEQSGSVGVETESSTSVSTEDSAAIEEAAGAEATKLDKEFLKEAMQGAQMEIKMGELASQKGQSDSVKKFGQKLTRDHQESSTKMDKIAQQKGLTKSSDLGKHQKDLDHLSSLSGSEFDRAFIQHAVKDHEKCVKKFQKQASEGEDPAIRSFASESLPVLQEHLKIAQTLQGNANASIPELKEPAGAEKPEAESEDDSQEAPEAEDDDTSSDDDALQPNASSSSSSSSTP